MQAGAESAKGCIFARINPLDPTKCHLKSTWEMPASARSPAKPASNNLNPQNPLLILPGLLLFAPLL
jgi:hypothetical protein